MKKEGPKLLITLLTRITEHIYDYGSYTYFLQAIYANHNGYILLPLYPDSKEEDYQLYRKLVPLYDALTGISSDCDYIVWMDADIVILDLGMRIEAIAAEYSKAHIIVSADVSASMNSGFIILRNTKWTLNFIKQWQEVRLLSQGSSTDQMGFEYVYNKLLPDEKSKIVILSPDALNSDAPPMTRQKPYNQVLHLAAESSKLRQNVFKAGMIEVCDAIENNRQPAHQLGLTQEFILQTTEISYGDQARLLLKKYKNWKYNEKIEQDRKILLNDVTTLRYDTSKHLYAVSAKFNEVDPPESIDVRRDVSQTIENIAMDTFKSIVQVNNLDEISQKQLMLLYKHQDLGLLLNLFKLSCESSYELLHPIQSLVVTMDSDIFKEWKKISDEIIFKLNFLHKMVGKSQQNIILDMKASLLGNIGDLYSAVAKYEESIHYLKKSLEIYSKMNEDQTGNTGDKRAMLAIQSSLARALCIHNASDDGVNLYRSTIQTEAKHVGKHHLNLFLKYFNAGICTSNKGYIVESISYFNDCIKICEIHSYFRDDNQSNGICQQCQNYLIELGKRRRFVPNEL